MATIDARFGQIKDRTVGYKPMHYCVGDKSKKYLQACLKAHETITDVITPQARESITPKEAKAAVLAYVAMDEDGKKELLKKIALSCYGLKNETKSITLEELADAWHEQRIAQGATESDKRTALMLKRVFFGSNNLTEERLAKLGLNPRQIKAVLYAKGNRKITSKEYQEINSVKKATATRDLSELVERYGIFTNIGKGAGSYYEIIGSIGS